MRCEGVVVPKKKTNGMGCALLLVAFLFPGALFFVAPAVSVLVFFICLLVALSSGQTLICGACRGDQLVPLESPAARRVLGQ